MPKTKDPLILERNAMRFYGCTLAEAISTNDGLPLRQPGTKAERYFGQRTKAAKRGIGWEITFPEWCSIWMESGHWAERGVGKDSYCMARHGDIGPYKVGNVSIQTNESNSRDGIKKAHVTLRERKSWSTAQLGRGRGWTYRENAKNPYQVVAGRRYVGSYASQEVAEAAYANAISEIRSAHSSAICLREPLNTTQQISEAL